MATVIPLSNVSLPQIDGILQKLNLKAPDNYDCEQRVKLLSCSIIYNRYLSEYEKGNISAHFDKGDKFIDFSTNDSRVLGIFCFMNIPKVKHTHVLSVRMR